MRIHLYVMLLSAAIVAGAATQAFAQIAEPISVSTDKSSYTDGDTVMITGEVANRISGMSVTYQIISPNGNNVVGAGQTTVDDDRTFSFNELTAGGILWTAAGDYTVRVQYGANRVAETTFAFGGSEPGMARPPTDAGTTMFTLQAGEAGSFDIGYSITGGSVTGMSISGEFNSLTVNIAPTDDGELSITLPRDVIDAKAMNGCDGDDGQFIVIVDRQEQEFRETVGSDSRTLTIGFFADSEEIEIIGTCAVPEFGAVAVVVLAAAVIAIVAVTARSRLSLAPRY